MSTITYSRVGDLDIQLDLYVPPGVSSGSLPAVIHFHGGGLVAGARDDDTLPDWLRQSALGRGFLFISPDYRLLHPCTVFDMVEDVKALFAFLASPGFSEEHLPAGVSLDASRIAVVGDSGGGYVARLAGIYAAPRPCAVFSFFGAGGCLLSDYWVKQKAAHFPFFGTEKITRESLAHLLDRTPAPTSGAPLKARPDFTIVDAESRVNLLFYWWRTGELLDYMLGEKVSAALGALPQSERLAAVPEHLRPAFPQALLDVSFPPTILVHGGNDSICPVEESQATYDRLRELGVKTELIVVPGAGQGLYTDSVPPTLAPGALESRERVMEFLDEELRRK